MQSDCGKVGEEVRASLLVDAREAARLCNVSRATWYAMLSAGRVPEPIRLAGRCIRWPRAELERWIAARCPPRHRWAEMR